MCFSVLCISVVFAICLGVCIQLQRYYFSFKPQRKTTKKRKVRKYASTQVRISDLGMYYTLLYTYSRVHYYMSLYVF